MRTRFFPVGLALLLAGGLAPPLAAQQPAAAAPAASAAEASGISERVRRQAERPYYWIRLQSQRAANAPASTTAPAGAARRTRADDPALAAARPEGPAPTDTAERPADPATAARVERALASLAQNPPAAGPAASPTTPAPAQDAPRLPPAVLATSDEPARPAATTTLPPPDPAPTLPSPAATPPAAATGLLSPSRPEPALAAPTSTSTAAEPPAGPLQVLQQVEAQFPATWMQRLRKGEVEVRVDITPDGRVQSAAVERSSHRRLEEAALAAVRAWRFAPVAGPRDAIIVLSFDLDR